MSEDRYPSPQTNVRGIIEAARDVVASASDTYKKRNGHLASFEDASGEKCWIVPFDAFESLRSALANVTDHGSKSDLHPEYVTSEGGTKSGYKSTLHPGNVPPAGDA